MERSTDTLQHLLVHLAAILPADASPLRNFFLMQMLSDTLKSIESFVTQSPEERYRNLIAERFDLVNRVPDKYIASMLGITPVSLSRIRKRINTKGKS
jgi:hypothetical protein